MRTRTKIIGAILSLVAIASVLIAIFSERQSGQIHTLSDGTRVTVKVGERGKPLHVYEGQFWQRPFYNLFGTNIPWQLRGSESTYSLLNSNATAVVLRRSDAHNLPAPWNGNVRLMAVRRNGTPVPGSAHQTMFYTKPNKGLTRVYAEDIYWEFTDLETNLTGFQLYWTNQVAEPFVLEFTIPNKHLK